MLRKRQNDDDAATRLQTQIKEEKHNQERKTLSYLLHTACIPAYVLVQAGTCAVLEEYPQRVPVSFEVS